LVPCAPGWLVSAIEIDGSRGEGGGQIVRTAAALSAQTGRSLELVNARANRSTQGLRPQHVAALAAVADACDGDLEGAEVGSTRFRLDPGEVTGGRVRVETGTAASTVLVAHALVPLADRLDEPLTVMAEGGTDVKYAPTLEHFRRVFVPWARRLGVPIDVGEAREGFYPVGGGRLSLTIGPREEPPGGEPVLDRGRLRGVEVRVRIHDLPDHIPERILRTAEGLLSGHEGPVYTATERVDADGPGVVVDAIADFEGTVVGANAVGEKGVPSETVAKHCAGDLAAELASPATVDVHTADQLVPLLASAAGTGYRVREVTDHLATNVDVVDTFHPDAVEVVATDRDHVVRSLR
jgi:RNA 3'-phosphate cyclase